VVPIEHQGYFLLLVGVFHAAIPLANCLEQRDVLHVPDIGGEVLQLLVERSER